MGIGFYCRFGVTLKYFRFVQLLSSGSLVLGAVTFGEIVTLEMGGEGGIFTTLWYSISLLSLTWWEKPFIQAIQDSFFINSHF